MLPVYDSPFQSFFLGGYEYATHRRRDGRRIDGLATSQHDLRAANDYTQLTRFGIRMVRAGVRSHCIKRQAGWSDFMSVRPLVRAAVNCARK